MKLVDLLNEVEKTEKPVKEVAPVKEAEPSVVDEIGKFFVVKKPGKGMTKEDMVCEVTVFDEIKMTVTIHHILEQFRQEATSTRYLGDKFEYLDRFPITV